VKLPKRQIKKKSKGARYPFKVVPEVY